MKTKQIKTVEQVKSEFAAAGVTVSEWARANGFHRMVVVGLLRNAHQGLRGESHRCAVALGLKAGTVVDVASFKPAPHRRGQATDPTERRDHTRRDTERRTGAPA